MQALQCIDPRQVRAVTPASNTIAELAKSLGFVIAETFSSGDCLFSIHWPRKVSAAVLANYRVPINVHPGYLPQARGMYPVFWAVFERCTAGASIHYMTDQVDAGPILERVAVPYSDEMTGGEVWDLVTQQELRLIKKYVKLVLDGEIRSPIAVSEPLGQNRTLQDFLRMRDTPPLDDMSTKQVQRLRLALTNPRFPLPAWAHQI